MKKLIILLLLIIMIFSGCVKEGDEESQEVYLNILKELVIEVNGEEIKEKSKELAKDGLYKINGTNKDYYNFEYLLNISDEDLLVLLNNIEDLILVKGDYSIIFSEYIITNDYKDGILLSDTLSFVKGNDLVRDIYNSGKLLYANGEEREEINGMLLTKTVKDLDPDRYVYFLSTLDRYMSSVPYNRAVYSSSYALGYKLSGKQEYLTKALEMTDEAFFSETKPFNYTSADPYRQYFQYLIFNYDWLKDDMPLEYKIKLEDYITEITTFWIDKIGFPAETPKDNYVGETLRISDSDQTIAFGYNLLLAGVVLPDGDLKDLALQASDYIYEEVVIPYYLGESMAGGQFAEGTGYSSNTTTFIMKQFLVNAELRGKKYDYSYFERLAENLWHETLPAQNSIYIHGDVENSWNIEYPPLASSTRMFDYAHNLMPLVSEKNKQLLSKWVDSAVEQNGGMNSTSNYSGIWEIIFDESDIISKGPKEVKLSTNTYASGRNFISMRTSWDEDAAVLYFSNSKSWVDHEHFDQLSFEIARGDTWVTNEVTGYDVNAFSSVMHNTILVEGAYGNYQEGSPVYSQGTGKMITMEITDEYGYINGDAVDIYNFFQWKESNHMKAINRKLFYLKPNVVVVYDHIDTDKNEVFDFIKFKKPGFEGVTEHIREIKDVQHFEEEPQLISDRKYMASARGYYFSYESLLPENALITVVDEKDFLSGMAQYNAPDTQRKWHITSQAETQTETTDFIKVLSFDKDSSVVIPETVLLTKNNGNIITGNVIGVEMKVGIEDYVLIYNEDGDDEFNDEVISFKLLSSNPTIYITGLKGTSKFKIEKSTDINEGTVITVTEDVNGNASVNDNGVLKYSI